MDLNYTLFMKIDTKYDWELYAWVKKGKRRREILNFLDKEEKPVTATEVKKAQKIDITQSAFTLSELRHKKLVHCLNPKDHHGKLFIITKKANNILKKLNK